VSKKRHEERKVVLSPGQEKALRLAQRGANLFLTGGAGTGKSFVLGRVITALRTRAKRMRGAVGVTASTGIAALNIGGCTIHALLGTRLSANPIEAQYHKKQLAKIPGSCRGSLSHRRMILRRMTAIVVDEVSMLSGDYIDMMDWWLRTLRDVDRPFGGVQMVFCGDFLQLPPVIKNRRVVNHFAFQARAWDDAGLETVVLQKVHRQQDVDLVRYLRNLRFGDLTNETRDYFAECIDRPLDVEPTHLFATNALVDRRNREKLSEIPGQATTFKAVISANSTHLRNRLLRDSFVNEVIDLKVGAAVLLARNCYEDGNEYVNGDRGQVVNVGEDYTDVELLRDDRTVTVDATQWTLESVNPDGSRDVIASMIQLPIKLAWAVSIHKSQGQTIDPVHCDLARCFEKGQAYVALSRAARYEGLQLASAVTEKSVMVHSECAKFHREVEG